MGRFPIVDVVGSKMGVELCKFHKFVGFVSWRVAASWFRLDLALTKSLLFPRWARSPNWSGGNFVVWEWCPSPSAMILECLPSSRWELDLFVTCGSQCFCWTTWRSLHVTITGLPSLTVKSCGSELRTGQKQQRHVITPTLPWNHDFIGFSD